MNPLSGDACEYSVGLQLPGGGSSISLIMHRFITLFFALACSLSAQQPPYDVFPSAEPPYYRKRYEASARPGELVFPVNYTIWIPKGVKTLRGVIDCTIPKGTERIRLVAAFESLPE